MTARASAPNPFDLTGRVAVVTGGNSSGIGLAMAKALVGAGATVCIWGRSLEKNQRAVEMLREVGGARVTTRVVDIAEESQVVEGIAELLEATGRIDACFANAAEQGRGPQSGSFVGSSLEEWRAVTRVALDGTYLTLREAARAMIEQGDGGSLVATSSIAAHFGLSQGGQAYSASKAGVNALIRGLALELGRHGIRANSILPAWVLTSGMDSILENPRLSEQVLKRIPRAPLGKARGSGRRSGLPCE